MGIINTINGYKKAQSTSSFCSTAPVLRRESTGWCAGPNTGLGLENMKHVISIHDVVSDTMHQFAPTYHNYVLYSNQGSKEAPKTVSPSAQQHKQWLCSMLCSLLCAFASRVAEVAAEHAGNMYLPGSLSVSVKYLHMCVKCLIHCPRAPWSCVKAKLASLQRSIPIITATPAIIKDIIGRCGAGPGEDVCGCGA